MVDARVAAVEGVDLDRQALQRGDARSGTERRAAAGRRSARPSLMPAASRRRPSGHMRRSGHSAQRGLRAHAGAPAVADQQHVHLVGVLAVVADEPQQLVVGLVQRRLRPEQPEPRADAVDVRVHRARRGGRTRTAARRRPSCAPRPGSVARGTRAPRRAARPPSQSRSSSPIASRIRWIRTDLVGARPPGRIASSISSTGRLAHRVPGSRSARAGASRRRRGCGRWCSARAPSAPARRSARGAGAAPAGRTRARSRSRIVRSGAVGRSAIARQATAYRRRRWRSPSDATEVGGVEVHWRAGRRRPDPLPARRADGRLALAAVPRAHRRRRARPARLRRAPASPRTSTTRSTGYDRFLEAFCDALGLERCLARHARLGRGRAGASRSAARSGSSGWC